MLGKCDTGPILFGGNTDDNSNMHDPSMYLKLGLGDLQITWYSLYISSWISFGICNMPTDRSVQT
jgi:hypothetical protein